MSKESDYSETTALMIRWAAGDEVALNRILERHLVRLRQIVRNRLGSKLRENLDSEDLVHDALVEFLRYGPPIKPANGRQFRRLMATIIENSLRTRYRWFKARRREMLSNIDDSQNLTLDLSHLESATPPPDKEVAEKEMANRIRFVLEFLPPDSRDIFIMREMQRCPFSEIGEEFGISSDAARMRHGRARNELKTGLAKLRTADFESWMESPYA
ncbi:MAG: sigma-70 family RNA polymerase sigma factor [Planctomycetota bacterium]